MKACILNITTKTDGQENSISRKGKIQCILNNISIEYEEENAKVGLHLYENSAEICRFGDYTLNLPLKAGQVSTGSLGIGGADGAVEIFTHQVNYSVTENSVLVFLKYDLIFGEDKQEMSLRIVGRYQREA